MSGKYKVKNMSKLPKIQQTVGKWHHVKIDFVRLDGYNKNRGIVCFLRHVFWGTYEISIY